MGLRALCGLLLMVLAGCIALLTAAFDPSLQATLPTIAIDPDIRHATNGLFDATRRMARILGSQSCHVTGVEQRDLHKGTVAEWPSAVSRQPLATGR